MASVSDILKNIDSLPAMPATTLRVIKLLSSSIVDLQEVQNIIRADEAIVTAVLRCANSVSYGSPGKMFSLEQSIVRLGVKQLLKIILRQQATGLLENGGSSYGLRRGALRQSAIGGALATEELARSCEFEGAELCFVCGLLRDIGKLALDTHFGPEEILECHRHARSDRSFLDAERDTLGVDHAELGSALAEHWGLPQQIVDAIRFHHNPPAGGDDHDILFDIVHAADVIVLWMGLGIGHDGMQYPLAPHVQESLLGCRAKAESIMTQTWQRLNEFEQENNHQEQSA